MVKELSCRSSTMYHPRWGYSYVPNQYIRMKRYKGEKGYFIFKTNKQGFPSDYDYTPQKNKERRFLFFGDSNIVATGVKNAERFTDILEKAVNNVEFYNFGLGGSGFTEQLLIFEEVSKIYEHDAIFFCPHIIDISRFRKVKFVVDNLTGRLFKYPSITFGIKGGELEILFPESINSKKENLGNVEKDAKTSYAKAILKVKEFFLIYLPRHSHLPLFIKERLAFIRRYRANYSRWQEGKYEYELVRLTLERLIQNSRGKKVILCPLPYPKIGNRVNYQPLFRHLAKDNPNVFFIDIGAIFAKFSRKERWSLVFQRDNHYSHKGHKFLAIVIRKFLYKWSLL